MLERSPHPGAEPGYRPDIDGLRAIAVLAVVGFHAEIGAFRAGFVGVDIFFVISGYLISGIILRALERDRFSFVEFYVRRINRIFPALTIVLVAVALIGWMVLFPPEFSTLGSHMLGGAGFASNFVLWSDTGYFASQDKPLLHLWSLAVEEQFYLFWPLVLFSVHRLRRQAITPIAVCVVVSFAINVWLVSRSQATAAFYLPFGRFWEILIGGLLVAVERARRVDTLLNSRTYRNLLSVAGLGLIASGFFIVDKNTLWPGWLALLPVGSSLLLIASGPDAVVNKYVLGQRALVWVGLISYPLYLWHWPLFVFVRIASRDQIWPHARVFVVIASFLLATLTYFLVERPIRFGRLKRRSAFRLAVGMIAFAGVAVAIQSSTIEPRLGQAYNNIVSHGKSDEVNGGFFDKAGNVVYQLIPGTLSQKVLIIGDSHASQYLPRFQQLADTLRERPSILLVTYGGCPPFPGVEHNGISWDGLPFRCSRFNRAAFVRAMAPDIGTVVFSGYWEGYFNHEALFRIGDPSKKTINFPTPVSDSVMAQFERELGNFVQRGKRVFLVLSNPSTHSLNPESLMPPRMPGSTAGTRRNTVPLTVALKGAADMRERLRDIAERQGVTIVDPVPFLCPDDQCPALSSDGRPIYIDDHHLRPSFVKERATFLDQILSPPLR